MVAFLEVNTTERMGSHHYICARKLISYFLKENRKSDVLYRLLVSCASRSFKQPGQDKFGIETLRVRIVPCDHKFW